MSQLAQRLIMAAGGGKIDPTYVDDVFSTHLYKGTSVNQVINNGIKLGNANAGSSVDFHDYGSIQAPTSADFKFGTGAFTVEYFIYFISATDYISMFDGRPAGVNGNQTTMNMMTGGQLSWYDLTNSTYVIPTGASTTLPTNVWTHVAYVREGTGTNQAKMYFNGSLVGTGTDPQNYAVDQLNRIGGHPWAPGVSKFYLSNYRVVKGSAVYTSNFTTPTVPLTDISGTVLLCCQSSTDPLAAAVTPGPLTLGDQGQGTYPRAVSFGTETANDGAGGLVWLKSRTQNYDHWLFDSERSTNFPLRSNLQNGATDVGSTYFNSFNNDGFIVGSNGSTNSGGVDFTSWTFRKQKGFFDIVTWTGNNTAGRTIAHNLGSIPGCIMVKRTDTGDSWQVYHRGNVTGDQNAAHYWLNLDQATPKTNSDTRWNDTEPTASVFTVGADSGVNTSGGEYIAYLFAGGASDGDDAARSIQFSNSGYLDIADHSDFTFGTDDFTIECWYKADNLNLSNNWDYIFSSGWPVQLGHTVDSANTNSRFSFYMSTSSNSGNYIVSDLHTGNGSVYAGQWYHVAVTRSGSTFRIFLNGKLKNTATSSGSAPAPNANSAIGRFTPSSPYYYADGQISNFRYVKGTAVYTSSFKPPTKPLTAITNTKLLCCNKNTVTGSTVTPGTITSHNTTQSITDTPFDDPAGFKFGADRDQNIIKCGSYNGNANDDGPLVDVGFEPQWIMIKNTGANESWHMMDCVRGIVTRRGASNSNTGNDAKLYANSSAAENSLNDSISLTPTGFKVVNSNGDLNGNGNRMIYIAIRRSDGYVGKPAEVGTEVFNMVYGVGSTPPTFAPEIPVDFTFLRRPGTSENWTTSARLIQGNYLFTNSTNTEASDSAIAFDYNNGFHDTSGLTTYLSWSWKRHAGFDVITYAGISATRSIAHNMGIAPEMMWIKSRTSGSQEWRVYHKGLNGGTNPQEYRMNLNDSGGESNIGAGGMWDVPTDTHITLHSSGSTNFNSNDFIAMLFATTDVSKVGFWIGDGTNNRQITTGFQPRIILVSLANQGGGYGWQMMDSVRGFIGTGGSGNEILRLDNTNQQSSQNTYFTPNATGFTITESAFNGSSQNWVYYAHA